MRLVVVAALLFMPAVVNGQGASVIGAPERIGFAQKSSAGFIGSVPARLQEAATCTSAPECRRLAVDALERQDFEEAHTLAWRAMQSMPKNDPESMRLLARAQSLSGRPHDALIMLQRLARAGVRVEEAVTAEDYRRVRELSGWPAALAAIEGLPLPGSTPTAAAPSSIEPPAAARPIAPEAAPANSATTKPAVASAATSAEEGLRVPATLHDVIAIAYDSVSRRFVVADRSSDALKIVDETSGKAMNLISTGWAGGQSVTALSVDTRRGDLWAASPTALHRIQMVSGRSLQTITAPAAEPQVNFVAVKAGPNAVVALDQVAARVYTAAAGDKTLRLVATLDDVKDARSLAVADDGSIYVAHADGVTRLQPPSQKHLRLTAAKGIALSSLRSIEWLNDALVATADLAGSLTVIGMRLNAARTRVTAVTNLGPASAAATTVSGRQFYYLSDTADGSAIVGRRP